MSKDDICEMWKSKKDVKTRWTHGMTIRPNKETKA